MGRVKNEVAYLWVQIVDLVDGRVDVTSMNRLSNVDTQLDGLLFNRQVDIGFLCKLFSRAGIAFADQVVHDHEIDITVRVHVSENLRLPNETKDHRIVSEATTVWLPISDKKLT
jgi:hypothetical protein